MTEFGSLTLIPYFTVYQVHYFCNSKTKGRRKNGFTFGLCFKNNVILKEKRYFYMSLKLNNTKTPKDLNTRSSQETSPTKP